MPAGHKLILASGSPRRRELLEQAGYEFEVVKPDIEEIEDATLPIREVTADNADLKAAAISRANPEAVVIAADTLVLLGDRNLSKPADREEASAMLRSLNGNSHQVFTAVSILQENPSHHLRFTTVTDVHFKSLTNAEMDAYHAKIDPMDKAGAYAAQEHGASIIDRIEGSMTNVIGLPMDEVSTALEKTFGILPNRSL